MRMSRITGAQRPKAPVSVARAVIHKAIVATMVALAVLLASLSPMTHIAYAGEIASFTGTVDDWKAAAQYDKSTTETSAKPWINPEDGYTVQVGGAWYKKNGESWEAAGSTFVAGTYRYHAIVRIADINNKFADDAVLVLDGESWTLLSQEQVADGRWQGTFASPQVEVHGPSSIRLHRSFSPMTNTSPTSAGRPTIGQLDTRLRSRTRRLGTAADRRRSPLTPRAPLLC